MFIEASALVSYFSRGTKSLPDLFNLECTKEITSLRQQSYRLISCVCSLLYLLIEDNSIKIYIL